MRHEVDIEPPLQYTCVMENDDLEIAAMMAAASAAITHQRNLQSLLLDMMNECPEAGVSGGPFKMSMLTME